MIDNFIKDVMLINELRGITNSLNELNNNNRELLLVLLGALISLLTTFIVEVVKSRISKNKTKERQSNIVETCLTILNKLNVQDKSYKIEQSLVFVTKQLDKIIEEKTSEELSISLFSVRLKIDELIHDLRILIKNNTVIMPDNFSNRIRTILSEITTTLENEKIEINNV